MVALVAILAAPLLVEMLAGLAELAAFASSMQAGPTPCGGTAPLASRPMCNWVTLLQTGPEAAACNNLNNAGRLIRHVLVLMQEVVHCGD